MTEDTALPDDTVLAWARLVRISAAVLGRVEGDLKEAGFPPLAWYDALLELRRVAPEGLRPYQLQERMLLAQYNLSRLTDRLARAGYIARHSCAEDGRGQVLTITDEGRALLEHMWPVYRAAIARHFAARLDADDVEALARILHRLA